MKDVGKQQEMKSPCKIGRVCVKHPLQSAIQPNQTVHFQIRITPDAFNHKLDCVIS